MSDFRSYISPISKLKYHLCLTFSIGSSYLFPVLSRKETMGNNTPDHQLRTSCPACHHQVEGEPKLPIQFIVTGDGNTSLSCLCHHFERDVCLFHSYYYISQKEVDDFSNSRKH